MFFFFLNFLIIIKMGLLVFNSVNIYIFFTKSFFCIIFSFITNVLLNNLSILNVFLQNIIKITFLYSPRF